MYACLTNTHVLVSLHVGAFTLLAIPFSSLDRYWNEVPITSDIPPLNIDLEAATESNLYPSDSSGLDILRINLSEPRKPSTGPWVITIHSFAPAWRTCGTDVPQEIFVVGLEKDCNAPPKDRLLSWRVQLSRTAYHRSQPQCLDAAFNPSGTWLMTLVDTGRAPATMLPWNTGAISNAGIMLSFHQGLNCFHLFCDEPQPKKALQSIEKELIDGEAYYSLESMDPYSGVLAIRTSEKVRVIQLE